MTYNKATSLYLVVVLFYCAALTGASCINVFYQSDAVRAKPVCPVARDCKEWLEAGAINSGVYPINPDGTTPFQVYCDMETDGGGWTVFQWRMDGSVDFYRNWSDYQEGFGHLQGEFWLGLSKIHRLTQLGIAKHSQTSDTTPQNTLRVDLKSFNGIELVANYLYFGVGSSTMNYTLTVSGYYGNATDGMTAHNGRKFTTKDRDNDIAGSGSCGASHKGAWWFHKCYYGGSHLNGLYLSGPSDPHDQGIQWHSWKSRTSLKYTKMMVRRK